VSRREGAERTQLEQADALAVGPQFVDRVFDRARRRAERDQRVLRILEAIGLVGVVCATAQALELVRDRCDHLRRRLQSRGLRASELEVVVRHREWPVRSGMRDVEQWLRKPVWADEGACSVVRQQLHRLGCVSDREAVLADEHR
jgi:hypothetical protein